MLSKGSIDFFEHVSGSGVFVFVEIVGAVLCDVGAVFHDLNEFLGDALHERNTYLSSIKRMSA